MLWENLFSPEILSRGKKYFDEGRVSRIQKISYDVYEAKVVGKRKYTVDINFPQNNTISMSCSCPYEGRCKHLAAALYKIDENYGIDSIFTMKRIEAENTMPFTEPEDYQYFNICEMTRHMEFTKEKNDKAIKYVRDGSVVLDKVEVGYVTMESENIAVIYGHYTAKNNTYNITIQLDEEGISSKNCAVNGCGNTYLSYSYGRYATLCEHQIALLLLFEEYQKTHVVGDNTDINAAYFMAGYRSMRKNVQPEGELNAEKFHIEPRLDSYTGILRCSFKVGTDKRYVVKNLSNFVSDVENGNIMKLGTKNELNFAVSTVADDSVKMYEFIKGVVKDTEHTYGYRGWNNKWKCDVDVKDTIDLYGSRMDEFFEMCSDKRLSYSAKKADDKNRTIGFRNKEFKSSLTISKNLENGKFVGVTVKGNLPVCVEGNKASYYISESALNSNYLNRFPNEQMERIKPLWSAELGSSVDFNVGRNRLAEFYYKIIPEISQLFEIENADADVIEQYLPPEADFVFYLDADNGNIFCEVEVSYGEEKLGLPELMDRTMPMTIRDYEQESYVLDELLNIFPSISDDKVMLHCKNDEDTVYYVLRNGIDRLMALGTVKSTDRFKRLKLKSRLKITVGVSVESEIMNLDISSDEVSREELAEILNSYRKKKKYHRLKNGDFINLDDETIESLYEMFDNLKLSPKDFVKGKMKIPSYRALYLDKMLENTSSLYADRDKNFKKLIKEFKTVDDSDFEVPKSLKNVMRNYQIHGYKWMRTIAAYGFGGILADDMGLGKTLQMISVLLAAKSEEQNSCSIIICPASLVYNWQEEFKRFAPDINTAVIAGNQTERQVLIKSHDEYDVLITSYDLLKRDIDMYEGISFNYEIIDEAQYIKTHTTAVAKAVKIISSTKRFALTGTPIENRLSELWSIFDYLMPGYLFEYDTFKREIENQVVKYKDETATSRLKRMVAPFILRRLKGDVLKDLPAKLEEIRYAKLEGEQQKLYDGQVVKMRQLIENQDEADFQKNKIRVLAELTKIRQICCNPSLLFEDYKGESAKTLACLELIESAYEGGHKMLVFSQFTSMLSILEGELEKRNIAFYKITGETKKDKRIELVNKFNNDDTPVFLISLKAGGTGLNLTGADIVIHYDPWWNVAVQNQATDRAHRIGQTKTVSVYKLIAKNSIEEKIVKMQEEKKNLADEILSGELGSIGQMSKDELLELIG